MIYKSELFSFVNALYFVVYFDGKKTVKSHETSYWKSSSFSKSLLIGISLLEQNVFISAHNWLDLLKINQINDNFLILTKKNVHFIPKFRLWKHYFALYLVYVYTFTGKAE